MYNKYEYSNLIRYILQFLTFSKITNYLVELSIQ